MKKAKIKLIYNPHAGAKRKIVGGSNPSLEEIVEMFERYQIPIDSVPSKSPEHAIELARKSTKEGYETVVAAGGDGTVATIAHGLIGSNISLAVLPLGSVMNIARMLSIPNNLELAVALIKIGRKRKIDVGQIVKIDGKNVKEPSYFIEQSGVGFDADYHYYLTNLLERHDLINAFKLLGILLPLFGPRIHVEVDGKVIERKARMVLVSNGPYSGPGLEYAPQSKLNDHLLTISVFNLSKLGLAKFLFNLFLRKKGRTSKVRIIKAKSVKLLTKEEKLIHADSRVFGTTPVEFKIKPECLNVIVGFPQNGESSLKRRTPLDY